MPLAFALILWSVFAVLIGLSVWSSLRRRDVVGTYRHAAQAFVAPPGHLFFRQVVHGRFGKQVFENFVVSVAVSERVDFKLQSKAPPAMRAESLSGYSDVLSARLLSGALKFRRRGTAAAWGRAELEKVAVALSGVPNTRGGALEARNGRLVLSWRRGLATHELQKQLKDPVAEALLPAQQKLERLAESLSLK